MLRNFNLVFKLLCSSTIKYTGSQNHENWQQIVVIMTVHMHLNNIVKFSYILFGSTATRGDELWKSEFFMFL